MRPDDDDDDGMRTSGEIRRQELEEQAARAQEEERKALPRRVYRQEYDCSFEDVDDAVFAYEDVLAAISEEVTPLFGVANG